MRAVRGQRGVVGVVDAPEPTGAGVLVRVASAGICGSDLHLVDWDLPVVMGHELAGTLADGTPVAVEPVSPCGACERCASGEYNLCPVSGASILGVGRDGGMAEACLVPEAALVPLAPGVDVKDACLVEPLAIGVHGLRRARVGSGERLGVVGAGSIGLLAIVAAQAAGAGVEVEARHDHQKDAALRLGAALVPDGAAGSYDVVVEASGSAAGLARAAELVRPGGRLSLLGTFWDEHTDFPGIAVCMKEADLVPASMYGRTPAGRDVEVAAALLAARPEVARTVITHRFPLDGAAEAFATARDRAAGAIKVVLEP